MVAASPRLSACEKKHWWLSNRKVNRWSFASDLYVHFLVSFHILLCAISIAASVVIYGNFCFIELFYKYQMVDKYIKDSRNLIASQEQSEVASALSLLDAALALSPRLEQALELKARALLYLRRFKDVADMLQDYIPSLKMANEDSGSLSSENSSQQLSRERVKLLGSGNSSSESEGRDPSFKCFSVSDLKKKVMAGLCKNCEKDGQWR